MTDVEEKQYVRECPSGDCDTQFVAMTPEEYRRKHAVDGVCSGGELSELFVFPTAEYREQHDA